MRHVTSKPVNPHRHVDVSVLQEAMSGPEPPLLIDVRMPFEFASGHVPGAINIPLPRIASAAERLSSEREVWLICRTGARSSSAARALAGAGPALVNVEGGTQAWSARGMPIKRERSLSRLFVPAVIALTLGLAPFGGEPHVVGKLRWVMGVADGMAAMDWFDLVMHGAPWLWFGWVGWQLIRRGPKSA